MPNKNHLNIVGKNLSSVQEKTQIDLATEKQRSLAIAWKTLLTPVLEEHKRGVSIRVAAQNLFDDLQDGYTPAALRDVARELAKSGAVCPSVKTVQRMAGLFKKSGIEGLLPKHQGSSRKTWGWEAQALEYKQSPTKPFNTTVAYWLRRDGWESATDSRVHSFIKSQPKNITDYSPKRLGRHYYNQNIGRYIERDRTVLDVGEVYQGDGHTCDVYVAHPMTGMPWRPELTIFFDVRSGYCVGWGLSNAESANTTLLLMSKVLRDHNHVPNIWHVDPGTGYKNKMIGAPEIGFCDRIGSRLMLAISGNAKGKGFTERSFGIMEERCGKSFPTHCGHDRTDRFLSQLTKKVERGDITLPTYAQYHDALASYYNDYNHTHQKNLGAPPAEIWAGLKRNPVYLSMSQLDQPVGTRVVRRCCVQHNNRRYQAPELAAYEGVEMQVQYSLDDDATVSIRDNKGRLICDASLVEKQAWLPSDRKEEERLRRMKGQIKRQQKHIDEKKARAGLLRDHTHTLATMTQLTGGSLSGIEMAEPAATGSAGKTSGITLDILNADYVDKDRNGNRTD